MFTSSTNRDAVSRVRSMNKLISADNTITDRAILKELKSIATLLIKRETNLRRLWQSPNLFTALHCIEMERVSLSECCDYKSPCYIAKSKLKIPKIAEGIFGLLIQGVFNVDNSESFKFTTPSRYANILKLKLPGKQGYFWIQNEHLYVSDENVERVNLFAYFEDEVKESDFNSCMEDTEEICQNPLDAEFRCPGYLINSVVDMVNDKLMKTYFRHIIDYTSDGKDDLR